MTDRFAVGGAIPQPCDVMAGKHCGGNWHGIIEKLDYIQSMGFTAIWISPVNILQSKLIVRSLRTFRQPGRKELVKHTMDTGHKTSTPLTQTLVRRVIC